MFYSSKIFSQLGTISPTTATVLVGIVNMVSTMASTFLLAYFGRKSLLWTNSFFMTVVLVALGITYIQGLAVAEIVLVLLFICLFEFSLGPIVWIYMSEVMTDKGVSLGTLANWIGTIIMAVATPYLIDGIGGWLFIIFGGFCFACGLFCLFVLKETKGLSNQQVANLYSKGKNYIKDVSQEAETLVEDE